MPNRILKESICRSDSIDSLSWFEEVLFYRLMVVCDDFGRFDGRVQIIKGTCFPLKDITNKDIEKALDKLSAVGLVRAYEVQGRPYLQLVTWEQHQQIRAKKSKYPEFEISCNQMISNVPVIQSNPNPIRIQMRERIRTRAQTALSMIPLRRKSLSQMAPCLLLSGTPTRKMPAQTVRKPGRRGRS